MCCVHLPPCVPPISGSVGFRALSTLGPAFLKTNEKEHRDGFSPAQTVPSLAKPHSISSILVSLSSMNSVGRDHASPIYARRTSCRSDYGLLAQRKPILRPAKRSGIWLHL
jgi:hypothetical protein